MTVYYFISSSLLLLAVRSLFKINFTVFWNNNLRVTRLIKNKISCKQTLILCLHCIHILFQVDTSVLKVISKFLLMSWVNYDFFFFNEDILQIICNLTNSYCMSPEIVLTGILMSRLYISIHIFTLCVFVYEKLFGFLSAVTFFCFFLNSFYFQP